MFFAAVKKASERTFLHPGVGRKPHDCTRAGAKRAAEEGLCYILDIGASPDGMSKARMEAQMNQSRPGPKGENSGDGGTQ